ncbi:MAG: hypothetical protein P8074_18265 [Anaerolineales bacterium]
MVTKNLRTSAGIFLLSTATLAFEVNLSRLYSVAQFYHFAFMIVSVALLGYGASGTFLALSQRFGLKALSRMTPLRLAWLSLASGAGMLGAFWIMNRLPFDSFSIAWEPEQVAILALQYLSMATPFFFSGMVVGWLLSEFPQAAGQTYAFNLFGSAAGCILALTAPSLVGGEGVVTLSSLLCVLSALLFTRSSSIQSVSANHVVQKNLAFGVFLAGISILSILDLGARATLLPIAPPFKLTISPYKDLSYALQAPDAQIIFQRWNAFSRLDVVRSASIHSIPSLSFRYLEPPPRQDGLFTDASELSPLLQSQAQADFSGFMTSSAAYQLRPGGKVLILEPRAGIDILAAQAQGAGKITAVEANPLVVKAADHVYQGSNLEVVIETGRSYLRRTPDHYDIILLSLSDSYRPVRSGAYSLSEDYRYTVEAFRVALARLQPDGILIVTRWLQTPPSEFLRIFATATAAVEQNGGSPSEQMIALRSYNTGTLLVKKTAFSVEEIESVRLFAQQRAFDLAYAPGIQTQELNRFNILPEPVYYATFIRLLDAQSREALYRSYAFDIHPPTDDRPFFSHFFKWSQAGQVLAELGKTWQPFGGAGYFVLLALLAQAIFFSLILILLPALTLRRHKSQDGSNGKKSAHPILIFLAYFTLIGLGFLLVEIPLIQRFILYLGHPAYALAAVLFALLLFSGAGSYFSPRLPVRKTLPVLVAFLASFPLLLPVLFQHTLQLELGLRLAITLLVLAPAGFLMGTAFPGGVAWLERWSASEHIPWVWAANGAASVISAVLAALLALSWGFNFVFLLGAGCYTGAWLALQSAGAPLEGTRS